VSQSFCVHVLPAACAPISLPASCLSTSWLPTLLASFPPQAIDLLDEAGSRVRIATYNARRSADGREGLEAAATSYMELDQVISTKQEAVQVGARAGRRAGWEGLVWVVGCCWRYGCPAALP